MAIVAVALAAVWLFTAEPDWVGATDHVVVPAPGCANVKVTDRGRVWEAVEPEPIFNQHSPLDGQLHFDSATRATFTGTTGAVLHFHVNPYTGDLRCQIWGAN